MQDFSKGLRSAVLALDSAQSLEGRMSMLAEVEAAIRMVCNVLHEWQGSARLEANQRGLIVSYASSNMAKPWSTLVQAHRDMLVGVVA